MVNPDTLGSILSHGIKRASRGELGDEKDIIKTDHYLDFHRPQYLKAEGLSRDNNIYAYLADADKVIDIVDGQVVSVRTFVSTSENPVVRIRIDPKRCFVSDLDTYDALKTAITNNEESAYQKLADSYWKKVTKLARYEAGAFRRPEVMITYDIDPIAIDLL